MIEKIAIGIIDVYNQTDLDNCLKSIPEDLKENVFVVSNTKNLLPKNSFRFDKEVSFASLRNKILSHFRLQQKQFLFFINSNYSVLDSSFFVQTVKIAANFGTWFLTGPGSNTLTIDDEEKKLSIDLSPELNAEILFVYTNLIKRYGYFNEQFFSNNFLETLDYVLKMRKDGIYPPNHFNPCVPNMFYKSESKLNKINNSEQKSMEISFGLFHHLYKFIPGHNDPVGVSADQMFLDMEKIQKNYARNL